MKKFINLLLYTLLSLNIMAFIVVAQWGIQIDETINLSSWDAQTQKDFQDQEDIVDENNDLKDGDNLPEDPNLLDSDYALEFQDKSQGCLNDCTEGQNIDENKNSDENETDDVSDILLLDEVQDATLLQVAPQMNLLWDTISSISRNNDRFLSPDFRYQNPSDEDIVYAVYGALGKGFHSAHLS